MMEQKIIQYLRQRLNVPEFVDDTDLANLSYLDIAKIMSVYVYQSKPVTDSEIEAEFERQLDEHYISYEPNNKQGDWIDDNYSRVLMAVKGLVKKLTDN